ncbi:hypothetical protein [Pseudomonas chlororaphis]|uniref:Uncharacterized protein n=1 Tax=Pseudomonas chlororaphis TaxID=587753 RepID=A0A1Q8EPG4_9PSED|nr:hypothetical protein [Pseudomonas chlororaphis]OLF53675.1 hypothetical protein BTN82_15525 [Pseudomonas chlororaphis]
MPDTNSAMIVTDIKGLALPIFIFTLVVVTGVLVWGLRIIHDVLMRPDPDNPQLRFIDKALSEKCAPSAVGAQPPASPALAPSQPVGQKAGTAPSSSRLGSAVGTFVLATMALGVGYYMLWALFTQQSVDLSSIGTYFLSGSALFAPYAFNQLSSMFKGGA